MDNSKKAKINAVVKKIKEIRAPKPEEKEEKPKSYFAYQVNTKPEKLMIGAGLAAALAILFDNPEKRKGTPFVKAFYKSCKKFYGMLEGLLDSTVAARLKEETEREFKDEKLEKMEIEHAEKITIYENGKKFYT